MNEQLYNFPPGGVSRRGASVYSSVPWSARTAQAPETPAWEPLPDLEGSDPHDGPLEVEVGTGPPAVAAVPDNIEGGGSFTVSADFDGGVDEGPIADNIHVD